MPYRFFTIPVVHGEAAEKELNIFLAGHQTVQVDKQFVADAERSFWAVSVAYPSANNRQTGTREVPTTYKPKVDYQEILEPEQFVLFDLLRDLRNRIADETKTAPYNIFNNAQLAAMVTALPGSIADLRKIDGVGDKKADKYGDLFLQKLQESLPSLDPANPTPPERL